MPALCLRQFLFLPSIQRLLDVTFLGKENIDPIAAEYRKSTGPDAAADDRIEFPLRH